MAAATHMHFGAGVGAFEFNLEQKLDALNHLDAGVDRETWHRIGRAAIAAGLTVEQIDTWSSTAGNYAGSQDVASAFKTIKTDGKTGPGTLIWLAKESGWTPLADDDQRPAKPPPRPAEPRPTPKPDQGIADTWNRLQAAPASHAYALRKKLCTETLGRLRMVGNTDTLTQYRGWLAVPGYAADGVMTMVEFVSPDGTKRTLKGSTKAGSMFTTGPDTGPIVVGEGLGVADTAYASTGSRGIGAFGAGNIRAVVEALRQRETDTAIVIAPDRGKEDDALKIAAEFNCSVATLPADLPDNYDINDLYCSPDGGFDAVQQVLEAATAPPKPEPLLKPVSVFDVFTHPSPPPAFVWDGYLPRNEVALLSAHGGTGKSTIALMLAVCAALGRPLFGVDTEPCKVVFVSLEDGIGIIRHRLAGICRAWLIDPTQLQGKLTIVDGTDNPVLFSAEGKDHGSITSTYAELHLLVKAENAGLVLIDNASDAFAGDEIQRKQVRAFIRSIKATAKATDAAVLLLSHVDKGTSRARKAEGGEGYSGSTAWHNSVRSRLFLTRDEQGLLTLEHQKSNLGKLREPLTLAWVDGGLPQVIGQSGFNGTQQQGRADDDKAIAMLRLMAEFESRGQYCSPVATARNNVFATLRSEPGFQNLKLNADATKRIINQCQRAKWIDAADYRKPDRHIGQKWIVTDDGRAFAGLPAVSAVSAVSDYETAHAAHAAEAPAVSAACSLGGVGEYAHAAETAESDVSA